MATITKPVRETKPRVVVLRDGDKAVEVTKASLLALVRELDPKKTGAGRWTPKRKQYFTAAIVGGVITVEEAVNMVTYSTADEWDQNVLRFKQDGVKGLRVTRLQE